MAEWEDYDYNNFISNGTTLQTENKCGCGKPVRYTTSDGKGSCNKYERCPTYDELYSQAIKYTSLLMAYRDCINNIDDYFEYTNESQKDGKKVHQLLQNLTEQLVKIEEKL